MKTFITNTVMSAGKILIDNLDKISHLQKKSRNDYATNVDIEVERFLKKEILQKFPSHTIVAEEEGTHQGNNRECWFIDPISSTDNYIHGFPHFAISLSFKRNNVFTHAAVYDPVAHELFYAEENKGAYLNNKKIHCSATDDLKKALVFADVGHRADDDTEMEFEYFRKTVLSVNAIRRIGSMALELCYVACGRADASILHHGDRFALPAGVLMVMESGGNVTDRSDNEWHENSPSTIATNGLLHEQIIRSLK